MTYIFEDSWIYKEIVQKGMEHGLAKGFEQGMKQGKRRNQEQVIVRFVNIHFPDLVPLAKQQVKQAITFQQLQELLDQLFVAHSEKEAKAAFLGKERVEKVEAKAAFLSKERVEKVEDISSESWAYKEMLQKGVVKGLKLGKMQGLEQGKKQNQEQVIVRFVEIHFPDLVTLAKQQVEQATTFQQLQKMLDQLFAAHSEKETKAILLGKEE